MDNNALRLSASSIARFKACPTRFRYSDVEGLRMVEDADALRIGTNWHGLQEHYQHALMVSGSADVAWDEAITHLNAAYETVPDSKTAEEWAVERESLVALFTGHLWYWADDEITTVATEIGFRLPLHHPRTGMPLSTNAVVRLGKIDRLILRNGLLMQNEYKTTSRDVGPSSTYWSRLKMDTQVSMYDLAVRDGIEGGAFEVDLPDVPLGGCLYDVTRKPTISPKKLTQAESIAFVDTATYCTEKFEVVFYDPGDGEPMACTVDGWDAEITPGAKAGTFAIRETPGMFRARLVADIMERPEYYYARREIPRTQRERTAFREQLYSIYRAMRHMIDTGFYYQNEDQCDQWGGCDYRSICWNGLDVTDGSTPAGMKRVFTPLTTKETD